MSEEVLTKSREGRGTTRRGFFAYAWLVSLVILFLELLTAAGYYLMPRFRPGEYGEMIDIGSIAELPSAGDPPVNHARGKFWLVRTEKGLQAFYKACTHLDCLFNWSEQDGKFICPCHGSQFSRTVTC